MVLSLFHYYLSVKSVEAKFSTNSWGVGGEVKGAKQDKLPVCLYLEFGL